MNSAVLNHLGQSTLFAALAGLLTLALRQNRAATRYWVWMAASMKFALPFSLLVMLGGHVTAPRGTAVRPPRIAVTIEQSVQTFVAPVAIAREMPAQPFDPTGAIEFVWACGAVAVLGQWFARWRRMNAMARSSLPCDLDFLVPVRTCSAPIEPGVFGIWRPVLLLPTGIIDRLTPEQSRAILLHEASHVRRRDNLTAFLHVLVEAAVWFHPLVWWIGARLVDERERACDEAVLDAGNEGMAYAEGILNICRLYVESPAECVAGVTGSDLKKRIAQIMSGGPTKSMTAAKRAVLASIAAAAIIVPVAFGILHAQSQSPDWENAAGGKLAFEAASVKLDTGEFKPPKYPLDDGNAYKPSAEFSSDFPLITDIQFAYKIGFTRQQRDAMLAHLPKWIQQDRYDIEARSAQLPTKDQLRLMMQSLLAERFGLKIHFENQETAVFAVTLIKPGKLGPGLRPHSEGPPCGDPSDGRLINSKTAPEVFPAQCDVQAAITRPGKLILMGGRNASPDQLAGVLAFRLDRPAVDQTGLSGRIDYRLEFAGDFNAAPTADSTAELSGATFFDAVRDQLGLKFVPTKASLRVLVIDSVHRPSEN